jgi:hypothetical protein
LAESAGLGVGSCRAANSRFYDGTIAVKCTKLVKVISMDVLLLDDFLSSLASKRLSNPCIFRLRRNGWHRDIPVQLFSTAAPGEKGVPLVVFFHGVVDRSKRTLPCFEGEFLRGKLGHPAHVLAIADPLLSYSSTLSASWYAGSADFDLPAVLQALIGEVRSVLQSSKLIFCGGSMGAHPALRQAWNVPNSLAIVFNPILHISAYNPAHVEEYRSTCWPNSQLDASAAFPASVVDNMATLYGNGFQNQIIYLQNPSDRHFWAQTVPFLQAITATKMRNRLLFISKFLPDHSGHKFPSGELAQWVNASINPAARTITEIARIVSLREPIKAAQVSSTQISSTFDHRDVEYARRIFRAEIAHE